MIIKASLLAVAMAASVPGAINPLVTQDNISKTICVRGWTKTVRPPVAYTNRLKRKLLKDAGEPVTAQQMHLYELDHLIPLELGGAPRDTRNLWLQPWTGDHNAHEKDALENRLNKLVCTHKVTLDVARACIAKWTECGL